ncbi:MAG: hypothetical protein JRJ85_10225 [Deltaproteobacteria bacterium]|nr:hypothetical protein [Deltaproteobacteria bacterium]
MKRLIILKKSILIATLLLLFGLALARAESPRQQMFFEGLKDWIGKPVSLSYACCGTSSCEILQNVKLKEVTDKYIVVITKGAPFLIPKHMIQTLTRVR